MGFKIEDIVHPEDRKFAEQFICGVCLCILDEPSQTSCDHIFCESCISPCLACPTCRTPLTQTDRRPLRECNKPLMRFMHNLKVLCPYHPKNTAQSAAADESESAPVASLASGHDQDGAPRAKRARTTPDQCDWAGNYTDLLAKHLGECPYHKILCPNGCGETLRRMDLEAHAPACATNFEACPICNERVRCGSMSAHRAEKAQLHVQILEAKLAEHEDTKDEENSVLTVLQKVAKTQHVSTTARQRTDELKEFIKDEVSKQLQNQGSKVLWNAGDRAQLWSSYPQGQQLSSPRFYLEGFGPFFVSMYPCGRRNTADGSAALFLNGPEGVQVRAKISIDTWTYEFPQLQETHRGFGRSGCPLPDHVKVKVELLEAARTI
mmetsp:Transcript_93682/g.200993  ORF Transcript_93682/g.200993 Transcript_93682/m.200993 type:complete len:379 (-) Transcript_93682:119-1255(-)